MSVQHRSPGDPLKIKASEWNSIARVVNSAISQGMSQVRGGVKVATCLVPKSVVAHRGIAIDPTPIASDLSPSKVIYKYNSNPDNPSVQSLIGVVLTTPDQFSGDLVPVQVAVGGQVESRITIPAETTPLFATFGGNGSELIASATPTRIRIVWTEGGVGSFKKALLDIDFGLPLLAQSFATFETAMQTPNIDGITPSGASGLSYATNLSNTTCQLEVMGLAVNIGERTECSCNNNVTEIGHDYAMAVDCGGLRVYLADEIENQPIESVLDECGKIIEIGRYHYVGGGLAIPYSCQCNIAECTNNTGIHGSGLTIYLANGKLNETLENPLIQDTYQQSNNGLILVDDSIGNRGLEIQRSYSSVACHCGYCGIQIENPAFGSVAPGIGLTHHTYQDEYNVTQTQYGILDIAIDDCDCNGLEMTLKGLFVPKAKVYTAGSRIEISEENVISVSAAYQSQIAGNFNSINGNISTINNQINTINQNISNVETEVSTLDSSLTEIAQTITTQIADIEDYIQSIDTTLEELPTYTAGTGIEITGETTEKTISISLTSSDDSIEITENDLKVKNPGLFDGIAIDIDDEKHINLVLCTTRDNQATISDETLYVAPFRFAAGTNIEIDWEVSPPTIGTDEYATTAIANVYQICNLAYNNCSRIGALEARVNAIKEYTAGDYIGIDDNNAICAKVCTCSGLTVTEDGELTTRNLCRKTALKFDSNFQPSIVLKNDTTISTFKNATSFCQNEIGTIGDLLTAMDINKGLDVQYCTIDGSSVKLTSVKTDGTTIGFNGSGELTLLSGSSLEPCGTSGLWKTATEFGVKVAGGVGNCYNNMVNALTYTSGCYYDEAGKMLGTTSGVLAVLVDTNCGLEVDVSNQILKVRTDQTTIGYGSSGELTALTGISSVVQASGVPEDGQNGWVTTMYHPMLAHCGTDAIISYRQLMRVANGKLEVSHQRAFIGGNWQEYFGA